MGEALLTVGPPVEVLYVAISKGAAGLNPERLSDRIEPEVCYSSSLPAVVWTRQRHAYCAHSPDWEALLAWKRTRPDVAPDNLGTTLRHIPNGPRSRGLRLFRVTFSVNLT